MQWALKHDHTSKSRSVIQLSEPWYDLTVAALPCTVVVIWVTITSAPVHFFELSWTD